LIKCLSLRHINILTPLSAVIPKKMVTEWGLKVGDKVMVHIEEGGVIYIYKNKFT